MSIENVFLEELRRVIAENGRGYQITLARQLGIRAATFSNMVNGRRGMDEDTRRRVAALAGINYESIASGNTITAAGGINIQQCGSATVSTGHTVNVEMTAEEAEIWSLYKSVPGHWRSGVLVDCRNKLMTLLKAVAPIPT